MSNLSCPPGQLCFQYSKLILFIFILIIILYFVYDKFKYSNLEYNLNKKQEQIKTEQNYLNQKINQIAQENNDIQYDNNDIHHDNKDINNYVSKDIHNYVSKDINVNKDTKNEIENKHVIHQQNNYHIDTEPMYLVNKTYERIINPLLPPERSQPYRLGVPINIPTRGYEGDFQQVGILVNDKNDKVLPLYGKPTHMGSSKWLYYTATDKFRSLKLPISKHNKNCTEEYGCDELYNDDELDVTAFQEKFKVNLYTLDRPKYIPYL